MVELAFLLHIFVVVEVSLYVRECDHFVGGVVGDIGLWTDCSQLI